MMEETGVPQVYRDPAMIKLQEPVKAWVEVCPRYRGPHCNEECASRLRAVFATYDRCIPSVEDYCPVSSHQTLPHQGIATDRCDVMG